MESDFNVIFYTIDNIEYKSTMAKGTVNKVIIIGRLGKDPEVRYMPSGMVVATLSLATNDGYKDKNTGQFIDITEWHRVNVFGQQAETLRTYAKKGQLVYAEGRIRTNKWQDNAGQDRYTTEIVAIHTQMVGGQTDIQNPPLFDYIPPEVEIPSSDTKSPVKNSENLTVPEAKNLNIPDIDKIQDFDDDDIPF